MSYRVFASMDIALIGAGKNLVLTAERLFEAGYNVFVATLDKKEETDLANNLLYDVTICSVEDAANSADIIAITTHPSQVREVAYRIDDVRSKVVIDASEILASKEDQSINTLNAIKSITGSQHVVKTFNWKKYHNPLQVFCKKDPVDIFMSGDSVKAKQTVRLLARDLGYADCYDFGDSESSVLLEEMARCMMNFAQITGASQMSISLQ